jgi:hypothetical protein
MSESKRSGYSIRADLLGMAIGILESRNNRLENNEHFAADNDSNYKCQAVNPYTTDEVLSEAEKLYDFVQKK